MSTTLRSQLLSTGLGRMYIRYNSWRHERRFRTCSPDTLPVIEKAFQLTKNVPGDYFEFGLYKGYTFYWAYNYIKRSNEQCRFFGFDSFAGLPPIGGEDEGGGFVQGQYHSSIEEVKRELLKRKVKLDHDAFLIQGYFDKSLRDFEQLNQKYNYSKARVVLIDCDLYQSTRDVLKFLNPLLQTGTILIMDDWNCYNSDNDKGERRATREFLQENPNIKFDLLGYFGWHGAYFSVKKV